MISREYLGILIVFSTACGVLYIHNFFLTEKLIFPSSNPLSYFSSHPFGSPNGLLQTAFQTILLSFSSVVSSSYNISFSFRNS